MPRLSRIDIPGLLQHVIVRGIERRNIFNDDDDRQHFVDRFTALCAETGVRCYAWALLSNHFHLLLMPTTTSLAVFMRRLLTGYAVSFNRRNRRSGHLFQNRYKSIVCEEEPYLLELVRYIHLNPLRAGIVSTLTELEDYRWTGHAILMGNRQCAEQDTDAILALFGRNTKTARQSYRQFVADGIKTGHREDLVGGGLKRSQGDRSNSEYESFDERVLGCGDFVDSLNLQDSLRDRVQKPVSLDLLVDVVAAVVDLDSDSVTTPGKCRAPAAARGIICHLATFELGYSGKDVGMFLNLGPTGVSLAARRGKKILKSDPAKEKEIFDKIEN